MDEEVTRYGSQTDAIFSCSCADREFYRGGRGISALAETTEISEETEEPEIPEEPDEMGAPDTDVASGSTATLNSGDYYLKELSVPGSYFLNETEYPMHLEYKDQETKVIDGMIMLEFAENTNMDSTEEHA